MTGVAALRYVAWVLWTGFGVILASKLFTGSPASVLMLAGSAVMMAGCAVMAVACGLDAVIEWRRVRSRS